MWTIMKTVETVAGRRKKNLSRSVRRLLGLKTRETAGNSKRGYCP